MVGDSQCMSHLNLKKKPSCIIFFLFFESPPYTIPENISSVSDKNLINRSLIKSLKKYNKNNKYLFPSINSKHKSFDEKRYWRGPVWVNWIIYQGLKNKDKKFAETIRKKTLNLVEKKKFREYYSCKSGLGMGAKNFSWTAALYLDFKLNSY